MRVGVLDPGLGLDMENIFTQDLAESAPVRVKGPIAVAIS